MNSTNNRGKQLRAYPVDFQDNLILGFFYGNIKKIGQNNSGDEIYSFIVPKENKREKLMMDLKEALDKTPHLLELVTELLLMKKNNSNQNKHIKKNNSLGNGNGNGNNGQGNMVEEMVEKINVQAGGAKKKKGYSCRKGGKAHTHKTAKAKKDCKKKKKTTKKKPAKKKTTKKKK